MSAIARRVVAPRRAGKDTRKALRKAALNHGVFALVPLILNLFVLYAAFRLHAFAVDFRNGQSPAGQRVLDGLSPYVGAHSSLYIYPNHFPFAYPALAAVVYAGFAAIPHYLSAALFTVCDIAAVFAALKLLRVRDWRLYGLAFLWQPVVLGWQTANITLLLGLSIAAIWYFRDRPTLSGALLALGISLKIIVWPLLIWLLATRRYRAFAFTLVFSLALNLMAWAVVGYDQLPHYLKVATSFSAAGGHRGYSVINLILHLGGRPQLANALGYGFAAAVAALGFWLGREGRERLAFVLSIAVALLATPIIWLHYFGLLLVPLALIRPRVSPLWLVPVVTFACPPTDPATWQLVLVLAVFATLVVGMARAELSTDPPVVPLEVRLRVARG